MSNPIETTFSSGATLYAVIHHTDGRVWNDVAQAYHAFNEANWASYAILLAEQGASGYYRATFPSGASGDFLTTEVVYQQAGGAPATIDAPATGVGQSQGVDVAAIKASVIAAQNLRLSALSMKQGTIVAGASTTTLLYTDLGDASDVYQGRLLVMTSGDELRAYANIASFDPITAALLLAGGLPGVPAPGDTLLII